MAAITTEQLERATSLLSRRLFPQGTVCDMTSTDIAAGIQSIDDDMEGNASLLNGAASLVSNLNTNLPNPFKTNISQAGKAEAIAVWAAVKYGVI